MELRPSVDLDAALEVFCQRVVYAWDKLRPRDQEWYRELWRPAVEAVVKAALND